MLELQRQEAKAEVYLKERHEREFIAAYIGHKAGSRKDQTRHQAMILDRTMWMTDLMWLDNCKDIKYLEADLK